MIVLIVGPSGIGKGESVRRIRDEFPQCGFGNLDDLASNRGVAMGLIPAQCIHRLRERIDDNQLLFAFGMEAVGEFASQHKHAIIDVGAAFQNARSAEIVSRLHPVIAFTATPETGYTRFLKYRDANRSRSDYLSHEFSGGRVRVYNNATFQIDTTDQSPEQTAAALSQVLRNLLRL